MFKDLETRLIPIVEVIKPKFNKHKNELLNIHYSWLTECPVSEIKTLITCLNKHIKNGFTDMELLKKDKTIDIYTKIYDIPLNKFVLINLGMKFYGKNFTSYVNDFMSLVNLDAIPVAISQNKICYEFLIYCIKYRILKTIGMLYYYLYVGSIIDNIYIPTINNIVFAIINHCQRHDKYDHTIFLQNNPIFDELSKKINKNTAFQILYDLYYPIVNKINTTNDFKHIISETHDFLQLNDCTKLKTTSKKNKEFVLSRPDILLGIQLSKKYEKYQYNIKPMIIDISKIKLEIEI